PEEEQGKRTGEGEERVARHGAEETQQQDRTPSHAIRDPAPDRSEDELRQRVAGHEQPDDGLAGPEGFHVIGEERDDDAEPDQVDEGGDDQDRQHAGASYTLSRNGSCGMSPLRRRP